MQEYLKIPQGNQFSLTIVLIAFVSLFFADTARSQFDNVWVPSSIEADRTANLVLDWNSHVLVDGLIIESTLVIESATFTCSDAITTLTRDVVTRGRVSYRIRLGEPIRGSCTIVVSVDAPATDSIDEVLIRPIISPSVKSAPAGLSLPVAGSVVTRVAYDEPGNHVGHFTSVNAEPFATDVDISLDQSFTAEFWMRTTAVDQVLLSTWNGREDSGYPIEVVIEPGGRLVVYSGQPGLHESMSTRAPVSDGQWHHVAVSSNANNRTARLTIDGEGVDSLRYQSTNAQREGRLTIAGRQSTGTPIGTGAFSGDLDEVRIWSVDRAVSEISGSRYRSGVASGDLVYTLNFEEVENPPGVNRQRSSLVFDAQLDPILVHVSERTVTLEWTVPSNDIVEFIVEESSDGQSFSEVGTLEILNELPEAKMSFTREGVAGGVVYYRVKQVFSDRSSKYSDTVKIGLGALADLAEVYISNFPNPFTSETTLSFEVSEESHVTLSIWDVTGQSVTVLVDEVLPAGIHEALFQASDLPSGVYFARFEMGSFKQSHKITIAR